MSILVLCEVTKEHWHWTGIGGAEQWRGGWGTLGPSHLEGKERSTNVGQDGREGCLLVSPLATPCLPTTPGCGSSGKLRSQGWRSKDYENREGSTPDHVPMCQGGMSAARGLVPSGGSWKGFGLSSLLLYWLPFNQQHPVLHLAFPEGHSASPWLAQAETG